MPHFFSWPNASMSSGEASFPHLPFSFSFVSLLSAQALAYQVDSWALEINAVVPGLLVAVRQVFFVINSSPSPKHRTRWACVWRSLGSRAGTKTWTRKLWCSTRSSFLMLSKALMMKWHKVRGPESLLPPQFGAGAEDT